MKYYIASDHAGFHLKNRLRITLKKKYEFVDLGIHIAERTDYPKIAIKLAKTVAADKNSLGILLCGTGVGMAIVANKVPGARAVVLNDGFIAKLSRQHNNANIACIGARNTPDQTVKDLVTTFLETDFLGHKKEGERHKKRVEQIKKIEEKHFDKKIFNWIDRIKD